MNVLNTIKSKFSKSSKMDKDLRMEAGNQADAIRFFFGNSYGGQTITGAMDYPEVTTLDYYTLRERSWSAMAKDELASMIVRRLVKFAIGTGLKLQCEPMFDILEKLGINFGDYEKRKDFVTFIEGIYKINSKSKRLSDTAGEKTLHKIAATAFYNAFVGGDVLVINRIINGSSLIQLVDGANICSPVFSMANSKESFSIDVLAYDDSGKQTTKKHKIKKGHKIIDGVEIDISGKHVGYFVQQNTADISGVQGSENILNLKPVFIPAYGNKTDRRTAWLLYGSEYRLGGTRGMPMLGVVLEKAQLLRRYSRAEVLNAEVSAKLVGFIEHSAESTGLNPMQPRPASRAGTVTETVVSGASSLSGNQLAEDFSLKTGGNFGNLGKGQKVVKFDTARPPANYGEYYDSNAKYICAALDVPWEVALMVFTNNFSASRMAAKLFEGGALAWWRQEASDNFYKPHYESFFMLTVLQNGNLNVPGYFEALSSGNEVVLGAYMNARFIGKALPHVDPLKEINTIKVAKEINARSMTSMVEETYGEDYSETIQAIAKDQKMTEQANIKPEIATPENAGRADNNGNNGDIDDEDIEEEKSK